MIVYTRNAGRTWIAATPPTLRLDFNNQILAISGESNVSANVWDALNARTAWVVAQPPQNGSLSPASTVMIAKTEDRGQRWQTWSVRLRGAAKLPLISVQFVNGRIGWMELGYEVESAMPPSESTIQLWRTTNGGQSWQRIYQASQFDTAVRFVSPLTGWMMIGPTDAVNGPPWHFILKKSTNGGHSWTRITLPYFPVNLPTSTQQDGSVTVALSAEANGILQTRDGGRRWSRPLVMPGSSEEIREDALGANLLWLQTLTLDQTHGALWRSVTGGKAWAKQSTAPFLRFAVGIDFVNANTGWVRTEQTNSAGRLVGSTSRLWMTTSAGRHWVAWIPRLTS